MLASVVVRAAELPAVVLTALAAGIAAAAGLPEAAVALPAVSAVPRASGDQR